MSTVLVVDDDCMILTFCASVLIDIKGINVLQAGDGVKALEVAGNHRGAIDLLITDITMPGGLTGVQLAQLLIAKRPTMKVLLMSGFNQDESITNLGWHFLPKPFAPAALLANIEATLGRRLPPKAAGGALGITGRSNSRSAYR
ncbi:MAG: multi-sensor hybrid histidine kinase [Bryobacterales bacterium]|nr:multi-sensor hybrid histidine kinase [Bryobacterales bacterium]